MRREAGEVICSLQSIAGVECADELRSAIEKSDRSRELQTELSRLTKTLIEEGDGLSLAELIGKYFSRKRCLSPF